MKSMIKKLERVERIQALDIIGSLIRAHLSAEDIVCDYGAGTGVFTVEAAKMTESTVYALDIDKEMIQVINDKAKREGLNNIITSQVEADCINLPETSVDLFILVTVLHEILDVPSFIKTVKRVLKPKGRVLLIDFKKVESDFGPSFDDRISAYQAARHFLREGIELELQYDLSDDLYQLVMVNN